MLFKKHLPRGQKKLFEIGCASGTWLIYFRRGFGYQVSGVDYSRAGCSAAREALGRNGVIGEIICDDVFNDSFQERYEKSFDIVCSFGFLEHFRDTMETVAIHLSLLRKGGFIIITMPNYSSKSLYRKMQIAGGREEELVGTHKVELMEISRLRKYVEKSGLEICFLDYVGPIDMSYGPNYVWPFHLCNQLIGYLTFWFHSKTFSPNVVLIARKLV